MSLLGADQEVVLEGHQGLDVQRDLDERVHVVGGVHPGPRGGAWEAPREVKRSSATPTTTFKIFLTAKSL